MEIMQPVNGFSKNRPQCILWFNKTVFQLTSSLSQANAIMCLTTTGTEERTVHYAEDNR